MKKLSYKKIILGILLVTSLFVLNSCCGNCNKPETYDVVKDSKWHLKAEGKLTEFKYIRGSGCRCDIEKPEEWCKSKKHCYFLINDTIQIVAGRMEFSELIKVGSTGKLYKYETGRADLKSWWQWIMIESPEDKKIEKDENRIETIADKSIVVAVEKKIERIEIKGTWRSTDNIEDLKPDEIVLIKLDNNIITTGFITYDKKWKLSFNVNKYKHGETISNVFEWKRINLE